MKSRIGDYEFMRTPGIEKHLLVLNTFYGPAYVKANEMRISSYIPTDLPGYFTETNRVYPSNTLLAVVTPMDENGNFYLGLNQTEERDILRSALDEHWKIVLEVNPRLLKMNGSLAVNIRDVTVFCEVDAPPHMTPPIPITPLEEEIGRQVGELIRDGDCLQMGIGGLPNAVARRLRKKNDLGLHTEQFTSTMAELIDLGVITGKKKNVNRGLHIGAFADGTQKLYETLERNPRCAIRPGSYVVDPLVIASNDNMVSINTLVEIDLTGQICAESIGPKQISGSGGAFCFAYGAFRSKGGRGIYAFPSRTAKGSHKIRSTLTHGANVTTLRNYVDWIVTEYGAVQLRGCSVRERAERLISVAHPDDRPQLLQEARKLCYI